ncbi:hypothetical protein EDC94DRAFT_674267 [Helicostylum pulchrum]|nr:hypothetical protein EDC94DRAFT_674267 [Helicostylum pulchrum]
MHKMISLSQESDGILIRLLNQFHSTSDKLQQQTLGTCLSAHFETYTELVFLLQPLIDSGNLTTLRDMYNVNGEIPSLLLGFDSLQYNMDDIDLIYSVISWKRREYLLYLLALDVMSNNRTNNHYGKNWRQAIQVNTMLVQEYNQFNKKLLDITTTTAIETVCSPTVITPVQQKDSSPSASSDTRSLTLMHRVSALEKHVEDIQAKLFLCKQDTKSLSSGRVSVLGLERMSKRFNHIDQHIRQLLTQWEESKMTLNTLLEDEQSKLTTIALLPSPPSSPRGKSFQEESIHSINEVSRSKSCSGGEFNNTTNSLPSLTKNRLRRIQSLKTNSSRIAVEK